MRENNLTSVPAGIRLKDDTNGAMRYRQFLFDTDDSNSQRVVFETLCKPEHVWSEFVGANPPLWDTGVWDLYYQSGPTGLVLCPHQNTSLSLANPTLQGEHQSRLTPEIHIACMNPHRTNTTKVKGHYEGYRLAGKKCMNKFKLHGQETEMLLQVVHNLMHINQS